MDSIVNSINETVRKYCVDDSMDSPARQTTAGTTSAQSASPLGADIPSPADSKLCPDASVLPRSSATLDYSSPPPSSASNLAQTNNDAAEVSFAMLARRTFTPESTSHRMPVFSKPASVDVGIQVGPADFHCGDVFSSGGRTDIGIQAGGDELAADGDGSSVTGRCCPYCHSELPPVGDKASINGAETHQSSFAVASSVAVEDAGTRPLSSPSQSVAATSTVPASLPSFVQCTLSLGDSFHYSPVRNSSTVATAPISIYPSDNIDGSNHDDPISHVPAFSVSACSLPMNTSLTDNGFGSTDTNAGQSGSPVHSDGFISLPNALSQSSAESSLINTPVVTFSITPETARLPTSADSGGQLSNTSLSNITLSDLLPSMQGSIPLELLVNQTDGFTMYTEIVPISEPCHLDPLSSINLPASGSSCGEAGVSEVAVSHESWSPAQLVSQQSPVNMMVCLPISSVSSPSLSSFLSQHKSVSSFAGDAAVPRPPTPETLVPGDNIEAVAIAVVPPAEDRVPKPVENYSIHRILETSALKHVGGAADTSWSSSNTGVLISRRDIPTNSAVLFDNSISKEDNCAQPPNINSHGDDTYHSFCGNNSCHGDNSCRGDDSDTHDDVCVIDSDRDVIVIDGDDEILRPNVGSDMVAAVPERSSRVGRHGRRRRRQTTKSSDTARLSRHLTTSSVTVELDNSDHSTLVNCLDNGFVEMSPSAGVTTDAEQTQQLGTGVQVRFFCMLSPVRKRSSVIACCNSALQFIFATGLTWSYSGKMGRLNKPCVLLLFILWHLALHIL